MANTIYNTPVTVYRGVDYNPDGSPVYWEFVTAFFDEDCFDGGEYEFDINEHDELIPTGTVGNAAKDDCSIEEFRNYCEYMVSEFNRKCG